MPAKPSLPVSREHPESPLGTMTAWQKKRELARRPELRTESLTPQRRPHARRAARPIE